MITPAGFEDFVVTRSPRLLRTAFLLTRDWALAEDLLQTALARAWEAWARIDGDPEPYVRRILVNTYDRGGGPSAWEGDPRVPADLGSRAPFGAHRLEWTWRFGPQAGQDAA